MKLEMRTVQKIAAAAMTLAVMFGCASPLKPLAASAAQNIVSVSADIDEENSYISAQDQMYQKDFLKLINKARAKAGLNSVELGDAAHNAAAAERAEEIATVNSHTRPDGSKCFTVLKEYGVTAAPTGENAAWGSVSPQEVVDAWMQSEGHRANILNPEARAMGVGYYYNSSSTWGHQWIQIFTK